MIRFCLNGEWREVQDQAPDITLLRYLRTQEGLTGTKEGCGSGDCGACTVLLGRQQDGQWRFESVNSCLVLLIQLHGGAVITVEALANGASLHPAQQAMVDCHGSQCGFCTPGFVMSLAGLHATLRAEQGMEPGPEPDDARICAALAGNLCRCTGYQPILAAARQLGSYPYEPAVQVWSPEVPEVGGAGTLVSSADGPCAYAPTSETELQTLLKREPEARLIAGGTDAVLEVTQHFATFPSTISLHQVASLHQIEESGSTLRIGAAASYAQLEPVLHRHLPAFAALLERLGSLQIRHRGSLGGNLVTASPIGDTLPILLVLGARVELMKGRRGRWLEVGDFLTGYRQTALRPGEYLRCIEIPLPVPEAKLQVFKVSKRREDDISTVLLAALIQVDGKKVRHARIALGGMAEKAQRAPTVESALVGKAATQSTFDKAGRQFAKDFNPRADIRGSREYRLALAGQLLSKVGLALFSPTLQLDVANAEAGEHA
ncbi:MAG: xanthine dehydrogenase small subunit [Hahellaceae bacterium]|jgi:xanthine dehydrogenase small subunit|nr:xanthine dehydrogenase small subunit [Hahellaceae bacterium]